MIIGGYFCQKTGYCTNATNLNINVQLVAITA